MANGEEGRRRTFSTSPTVTSGLSVITACTPHLKHSFISSGSFTVHTVIFFPRAAHSRRKASPSAESKVGKYIENPLQCLKKYSRTVGTDMQIA